jgi:hypothetical protein
VHRKKDRAQEIVTDLWPRCLCASLQGEALDAHALTPCRCDRDAGADFIRASNGELNTPLPGSLRGSRIGQDLRGFRE